VTVNNLLGIQTMVALGLEKQFSRLLISAGVFNVILCLALVRLFAAQGAGAAVLTTELLVTATMIAVLRRHGVSTLHLVGSSA
jgi:O-antigen/teichoic acid export membrane protein